MQPTYSNSCRRAANAMHKGVWVLFAWVSLLGCASAPVVPLSPEERVRVEAALGEELTRSFETQYRVDRDGEVMSYLQKLGERLLPSVDSSVGIWVSVVRDRGAVWKSFAFPGNRIYLSAGILGAVEYEHELAAAMAVELAHLSRKHLLEKVGEDTTAVPFGSELFDFSDDAHVAAVEDAFQLLYRAGFDPRGLPSLISIYRKNGKHSPYSEKTSERMLHASRQVIARTAPLRNPMLRSAEFIQFKQRVRKL